MISVLQLDVFSGKISLHCWIHLLLAFGNSTMQAPAAAADAAFRRAMPVLAALSDPLQPLEVEGVHILPLPFAQGKQKACAIICIEVACTFLANGRRVIDAPLVVDQTKICEAMNRAIKYWQWHVSERKLRNDNETYFSPGDVATKCNQKGIFCKREQGGFMTTRCLDVDGPGAGMVPRFVDELVAVKAEAQTKRNGVAIVYTCGDYTRLIMLRGEHAWLYDSHGKDISHLYYFDKIEKLLLWVLRRAGVTDEMVLLENLGQLENAALRSEPDCAFDPAVKHPHAYEIVVLSLQ